MKEIVFTGKLPNTLKGCWKLLDYKIKERKDHKHPLTDYGRKANKAVMKATAMKMFKLGILKGTRWKMTPLDEGSTILFFVWGSMYNRELFRLHKLMERWYHAYDCAFQMWGAHIDLSYCRLEFETLRSAKRFITKFGLSMHKRHLELRIREYQRDKEFMEKVIDTGDYWR